MQKTYTREQWLARCATVFDSGLARPEHMRLMREWLDALMRYEHTMFSDGQGQGKDWLRFLQSEFERTDQGRYTLANDADGYALQLAERISDVQCSTREDAIAVAAAADMLCELHAKVQELERELSAIGAGGVEPLRRRADPDLARLTARGATAWAGVDAQALRDGEDIRARGAQGESNAE